MKISTVPTPPFRSCYYPIAATTRRHLHLILHLLRTTDTTRANYKPLGLPYPTVRHTMSSFTIKASPDTDIWRKPPSHDVFTGKLGHLASDPQDN